MGFTWTVYAWLKIEDEERRVEYHEIREAFGVTYGYKLIYSGESRQTAMRKAREAKNDGCGCVKIEWR